MKGSGLQTFLIVAVVVVVLYFLWQYLSGAASSATTTAAPMGSTIGGGVSVTGYGSSAAMTGPAAYPYASTPLPGQNTLVYGPGGSAPAPAPATGGAPITSIFQNLNGTPAYGVNGTASGSAPAPVLAPGLKNVIAVGPARFVSSSAPA